MKANRHITAIITVLFIGFSTLNGQASARTEKRDTKAATTIKRSEANQARKVQSNHANTRQTKTYTAQSRKVQSTQATRQAQAYTAKTREHSANQANVRQPNANQNKGKDERYTTRYNQTASRPAMADKRPVSVSTNHNPKSNYGGNNNKRPLKENKFSEKHYYGGKHYHNAYPVNKVRTHYHHNTQMHHYNVLYYPSYHEIYWNRSMYNNYHRWYPNYHWNYNYGHRIYTVSVFDAKYNLGEVAMVYGRVYASWHNKETDDYLLFFGGDYPAQHFTVVLPGRIARKFSWRPERYFPGEHMTITGLITTFDGIPEIIVKNKSQLGIY